MTSFRLGTAPNALSGAARRLSARVDGNGSGQVVRRPTRARSAMAHCSRQWWQEARSSLESGRAHLDKRQVGRGEVARNINFASRTEANKASCERHRDDPARLIALAPHHGNSDGRALDRTISHRLRWHINGVDLGKFPATGDATTTWPTDGNWSKIAGDIRPDCNARETQLDDERALEMREESTRTSRSGQVSACGVSLGNTHLWHD